MNHARNIENLARPALMLGMAAVMPLVGLLAPFIVVGFAFYLAAVFFGWTWDAAMLPLAGSDEILDDQILKRFGAKGAIWGAFALLVVAYVPSAGLGWWYRFWPAFNWRLLGGLALGYAAIAGIAGAVNGTHFPGQVAYAWSNPGKSATKAWNCPASLASGQAEKRGRYDLSECSSYVDKAAMRDACRQVMRSMKPLSGPTVWCNSEIRAMTQHEWPVEGWTYKEWETSFKVPVRNLPEATPARMRTLLAKQGLSPR